MSLMIWMAAAALAPEEGPSGGYDAISADWDNINAVEDVQETNNTVTITFATGTTRDLTISGRSFGTLYYSLNSAANIVITNGGTITVTSGDTLNFSFFYSGAFDRTQTITVTDTTATVTVDSFVVYYLASDDDGGILPP